MTNPKYKFFFDELEDHEISRYSNGRIIDFEPSTSELRVGGERLIKALEARGYRKMSGVSNRSIAFSKPEFCKAVYVGTTVNPYSFCDKIWLWVNQFAISSKSIVISEVSRHNGSFQNATFRLSVCQRKAAEPKWYTTSWITWIGNEKAKVNKFGISIPTEYDYVITNDCRIYGVDIRKFKPNVSDKVLNNILDKAEKVINELEIVDPTPWEADSSKFPADTSKEYWIWKKSPEGCD